MSFKVPRGTQDILPNESAKWQRVEEIIRDLCRVYRYDEIRTPIPAADCLRCRYCGAFCN